MSKRDYSLVKVCVGVLAIFGLLYFVDVRSVLSALADIRALDLVNLFGLSFLLILVSVIKWRAFLERLGIQASIPHLFRLYLVGYFVNLLMPSALGGDVVRSVYVGKNIDKVRAVSATLLERYTGLIAMVLMALVAVCWAPSVTTEIRLVTVGIGFGAALLTVMLVSGKLARLGELIKIPARVQEKLVRLQDGMRWGLSDKRLLLKAAGLSFAFHLLTIVNTAVVGHAVGWHAIPWSDLLVVVPLILLVSAIPVSPQGLGIQEGAFLFFLSSVGATAEEALAVALVLRAKSYVLALLGGGLWFTLPQTLQEEKAQEVAAPEYPSM